MQQQVQQLQGSSATGHAEPSSERQSRRRRRVEDEDVIDLAAQDEVSLHVVSETTDRLVVPQQSVSREEAEQAIRGVREEMRGSVAAISTGVQQVVAQQQTEQQMINAVSEVAATAEQHAEVAMEQARQAHQLVAVEATRIVQRDEEFRRSLEEATSASQCGITTLSTS